VIGISRASETMWLVEWAPGIDEHVNREIIALAQRLGHHHLRGVRDIVPAYCTLGVHFDPLTTDLAALEAAIAAEGGTIRADAVVNATDGVVEIPIRYGGEDGPDLESLAAWARCSPEEVIERHAAREYRVYMLGFVPGFAYLGKVDPRIAAPRHRTPRDRVAVGSVGIAGEQTGVYPIVTPGGWQLIGRTDMRMFDLSRTPPAVLSAGMRVRFVPVSGAAR
jgi:KipI family sensor histidine kinase inhibitor